MSDSKIAFIYPGQGSQSVGMGKFLFENFPEAKQLFEEASDTISVNLKKLCFDGPESELMKTENTQPAIVTVSIATTLVLKNEFGITPAATAGHSVGEYAAAYAAGCMSASDAVRAVKFRGRFMQESVPEGMGAMAAFMGPEPKDVVDICKWVTETSNQGILEAANFNAPGQIVISGHASALAWLEKNLESYKWPSEDLKPKRMRLIALKVSAPFHCSLMNSAQEKMAELLNATPLQDPKINFIQNVSASVTKSSDDVTDLLIKQISSPVRWIECTEKLKELGVTELIEVGSGQVLKGLTKKIWPEFNNFKSTNSLEDLKLFKH
jgi:[acyl-carrier-protein] S-malonyltransferase